MKVTEESRRLLLAAAVLALRRRRGLNVPQALTRPRSRLILGAALLNKSSAPPPKVLKRPREIVRRRWWVRPIYVDHETQGAWFSLVPIMRDADPDEHYAFFRMTVKSFDELLELITPFCTKRSWRKSVSPGERLAITLRYIASGDRQKSLAYLFRVSPQCISNIIFETTTIIWKRLEPLVFEKLSPDLWLKAAAGFQSLWNIHNCVGAIDGKHVVVRAFAHGGSRYFNYKGSNSLILMAVCDAKYKFLMVDFGSSGRRGDANVMHHCPMGKKLNKNNLHIPNAGPAPGVTDLPFIIVGDSAFQGMDGILVPFKGSYLEKDKRIFNYRLSRARRVIENAFGILTSRYQVLSAAINVTKPVVKSCTLCCIALHNWHLQNEESVPPKQRRYRPEGYADYIKPDGTYIYGRWRNEQPAEEEAMFRKMKTNLLRPTSQSLKTCEELQKKFMRYFKNNPVPWQWRKIGMSSK